MRTVTSEETHNTQIQIKWKGFRNFHWLTANAWGIYRKGIAAPGALQFELRQSVSTSERSIYHTQAGFDPPFPEGAEFTEWKTNAITNQATTAGLKMLLLYLYSVNLTSMYPESSISKIDCYYNVDNVFPFCLIEYLVLLEQFL